MKKTLLIITLAFIGMSTANAQVGIGTTTPDASAILDVDVTVLPATEKKGFLPPRMDTAQRNDIDSPAEGLTIFNTEQQCLNVYVGLGWRNLCAVVGDEDVINPQTGVIWMDKNLGATAVTQTPRSDYTDSPSYIAAEGNSFGGLYQWGRTADGHQLRSLDCGTSDCFDAGEVNTTLPLTVADVSNAPWAGKFIYNTASPFDWHQDHPVDDLWQGVNGTNNPCPTGYRLPTNAEWESERLSWAPNNNTTGAFASPLKLPLAGFRNRTTGNLSLEGVRGIYWSSTVVGADIRRFLFSNTTANITGTQQRTWGASVRCIKD